MEEPRFLLPGGGPDNPAGHIRAALLVMLLMGLAAGLPFLLLMGPELHQVPLALRERCVAAPEGRHRLDIAADGGMRLDGEALPRLIDLRMHLDVIANQPAPMLALRVDPEVRYDRFLEILAVTQRANVRRIRLTCAVEALGSESTRI